MANLLNKPINMRDNMPRYKMPKGGKMPRKQGAVDNEKQESIKIAPGKKGLLHKNLGVSPKKKIPLSKLKAAAKSKNPAIRKRAQFALNFHKGAKSPRKFSSKVTSYA